jgi:hypothetical protein
MKWLTAMALRPQHRGLSPRALVSGPWHVDSPKRLCAISLIERFVQNNDAAPSQRLFKRRSKTWYLGRIARLFADPVERRWPDGNVWRKKG